MLLVVRLQGSTHTSLGPNDRCQDYKLRLYDFGFSTWYGTKDIVCIVTSYYVLVGREIIAVHRIFIIYIYFKLFSDFQICDNGGFYSTEE